MSGTSRLPRSIAILSVLLGLPPLAAQESIDGHWEGAIEVMGVELEMMVDFTTQAGALRATIDIPQQNASGLPLTSVSYRAPTVHFELPAGPGLAIFDGTLGEGEISGPFLQAGVSGRFHLQRREPKQAATPTETPPYKEEEVRFPNGEVTLAGTLTLPPTPGPHPAVIMITGSGPQNRDEELFGFKPFRIIADHLARRGLAVLRCDDRGVGGSTGSAAQVTSGDLAGDVLAGVSFLMTRPDINHKQIGLCGHSEGGLIAPVAATRSTDVAFVILLSGPGVAGDILLLAQGESIAKASGATDHEIEEATSLQKRIFQAVRTGRGFDELKDDIRMQIQHNLDVLKPEERDAIVDTDRYVSAAVDGAMKTIQSPWLRFFLDHDPAPVLEKVTCPVLALFGEMDTQVPAAMNKVAMESALKKGGNRDYTLTVIPRANHLYQEARTGSPSEYSTLKKEFAPGFLDLVANWVLRRVTVSG